ncbi:MULTISPECIES: DUF6167 family protein [Aeromicrobium]|uniref:DUF6167 family protein n=1 Tax=Aeromicrobium TaxID=2040 RepID=UPI0006F30B34|nr:MULTISPECIES: DUF6167 family protein [Aeromicrobium]KQX75635.1 hypothetical protein ASD10_10880 [Aeromicrobium sp. Root472D3]MCL8251078.1 DUF6167 family protein [Aeromicrobium fastidiosum]
MSSRLVWFVAGTAAGVYTSVKARRAAYRLSAPGVVDQAAALGTGWRELSAEVREGMRVREQQIAHRLSELPPTAADPPVLDEAPRDTPPTPSA